MSEPKVIRVTYREEEAHFLEAFEFMPRDPSAARKSALSYGLGLIVGLCLMGLVGFLAYRKGDKQWWLPFMIFAGVCAVVWYTNLSRQAQRKALLKQLKEIIATPPSEAWAAFSESGFLLTGSKGRSTHYPWQSIAKVISIDRGSYVFIDETTSYWFPTRIFEAPEDYSKALDFIRHNVPHFVDQRSAKPDGN